MLPSDVGAPEIARHLAMFMRNWAALLAYRPQPYPGRLDLLPAAEGSNGHDGAGDAGAAWSRLAAGGAAVHPVPGDHYSMLRPPHLAALAACLEACLSRAGAAARAGGRTTGGAG